MLSSLILTGNRFLFQRPTIEKNKSNIVRGIKTCCTANPKREKITREKIRNIIEYQGLSHKEKSFNRFGIKNTDSPKPNKNKTRMVTIG